MGSEPNTPDRRRGPRSDVDVPALLLDTAEVMFGAQGVSAVSMRAVALAAGVSPAAAPYHFPTKRDLLEAVVRRRSTPLVERIGGALTALSDRPPGDVTPRELVQAVLEPFVDELCRDPAGALPWLKVLTGLALADDPIWVATLTGDTDLVESFLALAGRAVPHLSEEDLTQRLGIAMYSMLTVLAGSDLAGYGRPLGESGLSPRFVEQLLTFTSAGLMVRPGLDRVYTHT